MAKIPDEVYVTAMSRPEREYPIPGNYNHFIETDHTFGFLHPHEPKLKADAKRKKTQMDWAYGSGYDYGTGRVWGPYEKNGVWWQKGADVTWDPVTHRQIRTEYDRPIPDHLAPKIWANTPLTGFKLIDTVNRYRGNKLFKVLDPRGVEFEITVNSLYHILQEGTVQNGIILDACVWKSGKNLVVHASTNKDF